MYERDFQDMTVGSDDDDSLSVVSDVSMENNGVSTTSLEFHYLQSDEDRSVHVEEDNRRPTLDADVASTDVGETSTDVGETGDDSSVGKISPDFMDKIINLDMLNMVDDAATNSQNENNQQKGSVQDDSPKLPYVSRHDCAMLFVDISGFTKLSTLLDVESLSKVSNTGR
jgi:hypothetical protein